MLEGAKNCSTKPLRYLSIFSMEVQGFFVRAQSYLNFPFLEVLSANYPRYILLQRQFLWLWLYCAFILVFVPTHYSFFSSSTGFAPEQQMIIIKNLHRFFLLSFDFLFKDEINTVTLYMTINAFFRKIRFSELRHY